MAHRELFVSLPVHDVDRSVECFTNLGFQFDERFTDETATDMVIGKDAYAILQRKARFADFTTKQICDCTTHIEAMLAARAETGEAVDHASAQLLAAGGSPAGETLQHGFMCTRAAPMIPTSTIGRSSGWIRGCHAGRRRRSIDKLRCECGHARSHT